VNSATLDGSKSSDPDGTISSFSWAQVSGPGTATITNGNTANPVVSGLIIGQYVFSLTVTDNSGATSTAQVKISVTGATNQPPVANAGVSRSITLPVNSIVLDGSSSFDPDGSIVSYNWVMTGGPGTVTFTGANTVKPTVSGLQAGQYIFELTVVDDKGASAKDQVTITVNPAAANQPPVANAGPDQSLILPNNSSTLDGSASHDPDGNIVSYTWQQVSGPNTATLASPNAAKTTVSGLVAGTYRFDLTVRDNAGATAQDEVIISITTSSTSNGNPQVLANAGNDTTIAIPANSVLLNGSASWASSGTITTYQWQQVSGPAAAVISASDQASTSASDLVAGDYVFRLTVTDINGIQASDTVSVKVVSELKTQDQVLLYPNPAQDMTMLRLISDKMGTVRINFYDMAGRLIQVVEADKELNFYEKSLDLVHLARGTYVLQIFIGVNKPMAAKLIKQ
jgi:hypothetical protein